MTLNVPAIPAGEALAALDAGWRAQASGGLTASWMLHGRPGIGKTEIVQTLARRIGARLFDLRLTAIEPADLRGLPYYDHEAKRTVWYRPEDLPDDPSTPAILFLDELTAAPPSLQPVVYGLLQARRVGLHALPPSVMVVAAGNTVEDGAVAYEMGTALSDRLIHLHVRAAAADWIDGYAVPARLDPAVIALIRSRPDLLETTEAALERGETVAATPRSWERASRIAAAIPDRDLRLTLIAGVVGEAAAAEYARVADDLAATLDVGRLLDAPSQADRWDLYPPGLTGLHGLVYALAARLDANTAPAAIEILAGVEDLPRRRPDEGFDRLPLGELATLGFETLAQRALDLDLADAFLASPVYRRWDEGREAAE